MDFGCRWSNGNNHSLRGRVRCVVLIASFREARVRGLALKKGVRGQIIVEARLLW